MARSVGFLHTSPVHTIGFEGLVAAIAPGSQVVSLVDEQLLARARIDGPAAPGVIDGVSARIDELVAGGAESIVCTCSTIGAVAEQVGAARGLDVVRVDRAMAEQAVRIGGRVVVLAALESTLGPTTQLLSEVAAAAGATIELRALVVPDAWERFEAGDHERYAQLVADAITAVAVVADVVVLAQASMARAVDDAVTAVPVLTSPRPAVEALFTAS